MTGTLKIHALVRAARVLVRIGGYGGGPEPCVQAPRGAHLGRGDGLVRCQG
jgi:hypothetical protein